jgi:methylated-DNA-[protein]-cysteine S-methyltransferase
MIFETTVETPVGALRLLASDEALRAVIWPRVDRKREMAGEPIECDDHPVLTSAARQLMEYFSGRRRVFDLQLDPVGTPFQLRAWSHLRDIPYGTTRTYGEQAAAMGRPTASRAVGAANGRNPLSIFVPCHRVIGADGSLTGFAGGLETKQFLLELEARSPSQ